MAVHHFTAVGLESSRGWQPMDTFPCDGTVVEVHCGNGNAVSKAQWRDGQIWSQLQLTGEPQQWRYEED